MPSFCHVTVVGNLTRDPELRYTPGGAAVCDLSVAVNRTYTNRQTNQKVEEVSFIDCTAWGRTAEVAAEYLKKGRPVLFAGYLKQDRWESPEGKKMSKVKVIVETMQFLGSKDGGASHAAPESAPADAGVGGDDDNVPF